MRARLRRTSRVEEATRWGVLLFWLVAGVALCWIVLTAPLPT